MKWSFNFVFMRKMSIILFSLFFVSTISWGQTTFPTNGSRENFKESVVILAKKIHISPYKSIDNGYLLFQDGRIRRVGPKSSMPKDARVIDYGDLHIYPGFVELWSNYGQPKAEGKPWNPRPQLESSTPGPYYWNEAIKPEQNGVDGFSTDEKSRKGLLEKGVTSVLTHKKDGIIRGSGMLIMVGENQHESIINNTAGLFFSYSKGVSKQSYPSSLMGSIALIKQAISDADWYSSKVNRDHENLSLAAFNSLRKQPWIFEAGDAQTVLRTNKLAQEFNQTPIAYGGNDAYKWISQIRASNSQLILNMDFPKAYDINDPEEAKLLTYTDLKEWELAPFNAALMQKNNIPFVISTDKVGGKDFWKNLRKAIANGLDEQKALAALTTIPAQWIGSGSDVGSLSPGHYANFLVADGNLFEDGELLETWVNGTKTDISSTQNRIGKPGKYTFSLDTITWESSLTSEVLNVTKVVNGDTTVLTGKLKWDSGDWSFKMDNLFAEGGVSLVSSGPLKNGYALQIRTPNGEIKEGQLTFISAPDEKVEDTVKDKKDFPKTQTLPFVLGKDNTNSYLLKNATVWTNEASGVLENTDVRISGGKIAEIGNNLGRRGAVEIDATGMHLTAGIVDEHSHIAISKGVNEGGQAVSAEVSIGDVVNAEDVNIFRQLAGGVTAAQLLHGSANPIGGQSALIKLRYGQSADQMKIKGADGFIKFALGENVKQSNWGRYNTVRFPQTRMGVEQVFADAFTAALDYEKQHKRYSNLPPWEKATRAKPRKDYELEIVLEIVRGKRFVSCHSYVQSEINMLMKVAERFNFRINTFTHILEGYKVADKMKEHGAAGSTFSDWWAYKFEVNDAIPYNGAIMHEQGVLTGFNSDDAEMGRRLNQEAGKAVKYGNVGMDEALKFVTLNPAKMLHLDKRMGSVKVGKDADLVLWTANPLSVYAKASKTFVDGQKLFDLDLYGLQQEQLAAEKNEIIQKMLGAKAKGEPTQAIKTEREKHYHCETLEP